MNIKVKKLNEAAIIPEYKSTGAAGLDLTATSYKYENERHVYGTGLAVEIPEGYVGLIFPRSSISSYDLRLSNCVGVIDSDYRGEITFKFEESAARYHDADELKFYDIGDRIGQLVIMSVPKIELVEAEELSQTERGSGGYGSTNVERSQAV